jgi:hypothetical protein
MYKKEEEEYIFQRDQIPQCRHQFIRLGANVQCMACGIGFYDPECKFPLEEANKEGKLEVAIDSEG